MKTSAIVATHEEPSGARKYDADLEKYLQEHLPRRLVRRAVHDYQLNQFLGPNYEMDNERFERELENANRGEPTRARKQAARILGSALLSGSIYAVTMSAIDQKPINYQAGGIFATAAVLLHAADGIKRALNRRKQRQDAFYENTMPLTLFNNEFNRFAQHAEIAGASGSVQANPEWKLSYDANTNEFTIQQRTASRTGSETHTYTRSVNTRADMESLVSPMPLNYRGAAADVGMNLIAATKATTAGQVSLKQ